MYDCKTESRRLALRITMRSRYSEPVTAQRRQGAGAVPLRTAVRRIPVTGIHHDLELLA